MYKYIILTALALTACACTIACAGNKSSRSASLDNDLQKFSYTVGQQIGSNLKRQGLELDIDAFALAVDDVFAEKEPRLSREAQTAVMQQQMAKMQEKRSADSVKQKAEGEAFLAENAKKEGVKVTESGLQYKVLTAGKGKSPKASDKVKVHYRGTLIDGTEFDSSYKRGEPAQFPVGGVIGGWTEALQLMKEGAKWQLFIPSDLAYGARGAGKIPPHATLTFEVELLEIVGDESADKGDKTPEKK